MLVGAQNWMWNKQMDSDGLNRPVSTVFHDNKIFYAGEFLESFSYDGQSLSSNGLRDVYIAKMSKNADLEWITQIGGAETDWVSELKISNNNIYVTGSISGTADFSGTSVSHSDNYDSYIAKYDFDGNIIWAKNLVWGNNLQMVLGMCVDADDNIIVTGYFLEEVNFGNIATPLSCVYDVEAGTNVFIAKFNSDGDLLWRKVFKSDNDARLKTVDTYDSDIYVGGFFRGNLIYQTDTFSSYTAAFDDLLLLKLNSSGDISWSRIIGGNNHDRINKVNVDENGNAYINGYYRSTDLKLDQNETGFILSSEALQGNYDFIVAKYSASGDLLWYDVNGGTGNDNYINSDIRNGKLLLTGVFSNQLIFNSDTLTTSGTGTNSFFTVYDLQGSILKAKYIDGVDADRGTACHIDENGNFYISSFIKSANLTVGSEIIENLLPVVGNSLISKFGCFDELSLSSTPVKCVDGMGIPYSNDGTASVTPIGGSAPFSFAWSNGSTNQNIIGLDVGTYTVTVSDNEGCIVTGSIDVGFLPAVSAQIVSTVNASCFGSVDGFAIAGGLNGSSPYLFNWSNGSTTETSGLINSGTYYVTVYDQCGNADIASAIISQPNPISVSFDETCTPKFTCHGIAEAIPTGGTPPYTYTWSTGQTTNPIVNLCAGNFFITVTDANGCVSSGNDKAKIKNCAGGLIPAKTSDYVNVYPVPATDYISIDIVEVLYGAINVRVFDLVGREIINNNYNLEYENKIDLNTSELQTGIYQGIIQIEGATIPFRFSIK